MLNYQAEGCLLEFVGVTEKILMNVTGYAEPARFLLVMGPAGCGKTTLLSCLAGRTKLESGSIQLNGERLNLQNLRKICYVMQQDIFFPDLTLRQTLHYAALLRLPDSWTYEDKINRVNHVVDVLNLVSCQHTIMGDYMKRGLSRSDRKRANIACELLTNPALLLLDEPTSSLDSHAAYHLMSSLKKYAENENKTVVISMHQPSSSIFHMFDKLLLLCNGQTAYFGEVDKVLHFFSNIGRVLKPHYNPADFILEELEDIEKPCTYEHFRKEGTKTFWLEGQSHGTCFWTQFKVLSQRNFQEATPRVLSKLNWMQTIIIGIMSGLLWFQLPRTEDAVPGIKGWTFFACTYTMQCAYLCAIYSFPSERENKELQRGTYRLSAYYLAKMVGELPLTITLPVIYYMISYPMFGVHSFKVFFLLLAFVSLNAIVAQSFGVFISACCMKKSKNISMVVIMASNLFGGHIVTNLPTWLNWIRRLNMIHYAYENMKIIEFNAGSPILCATISKFEICKTSTYVPASDILGIEDSALALWCNTIILILLLIVFRVLGYVVLLYFRKPKPPEAATTAHRSYT